MDRRIIPMTASHKVSGESRKENSLPAPMNSPHFLGAASRIDLDADLPRLVMESLGIDSDKCPSKTDSLPQRC